MRLPDDHRTTIAAFATNCPMFLAGFANGIESHSDMPARLQNRIIDRRDFPRLAVPGQLTRPSSAPADSDRTRGGSSSSDLIAAKNARSLLSGPSDAHLDSAGFIDGQCHSAGIMANHGQSERQASITTEDVPS